MKKTFFFCVISLLASIIQLSYCDPLSTLGCKFCATCGGNYPYAGGQKINSYDYGDWNIFGQTCQGNAYRDLHTQWSLCCTKDYDIEDGICKFCLSCGGSYPFYGGRRYRRNDWGGFNISGDSCLGSRPNSLDEFNLCCTKEHLVNLCNDCGSNQVYGGRRINDHDYGQWSINRSGSCGGGYNYYDTLDEYNICSNNCPLNYNFQNGQCYPICSQNCKKCNRSNTCDTCYDGYGKNSNGLCVKCPLKCEECANDSCLICSSDYTVVSGQCQPNCLDNCKSCKSPLTCDVCNLGYVLQGKCIECPSNCDNCGIDGKCSECSTGYSIINGLCIPICFPNCYSCSLPNTCDLCNLGYALDSYEACVKCFSNCDKCLPNGNCITCSFGYTLSSGLCYPICGQNCQTCKVAYTCEICQQNYIKDSQGVCQPNCNQNCQCKQPFTCDSCISGAFKDTDGTCVQCIDNCKSCSSISACAKCNSGYNLVGDACNPICPSNCLKCIIPNVCTECLKDFSKNSEGQCIKCLSDNCDVCNSEGICLKCQSKFYLNDNNQCIIKCSDNCNVCIEPLTCLSCNLGFSIIKERSICQPIYCMQNCAICLSEVKCYQCNEGYNLNSTQSECILNTNCPLNCKSCTDKKECYQCQLGYRKINNTCILECPINCSKCDNDNQCTSCADGFKIYQGKCQVISDQANQPSSPSESFQSNLFFSFKSLLYLILLMQLN